MRIDFAGKSIECRPIKLPIGRWLGFRLGFRFYLIKRSVLDVGKCVQRTLYTRVIISPLWAEQHMRMTGASCRRLELMERDIIRMCVCVSALCARRSGPFSSSECTIKIVYCIRIFVVARHCSDSSQILVRCDLDPSVSLGDSFYGLCCHLPYAMCQFSIRKRARVIRLLA